MRSLGLINATRAPPAGRGRGHRLTCYLFRRSLRTFNSTSNATREILSVTPETLARIQSLEQTNRWLKAGMLVIGCLALVGVLRAPMQIKPLHISSPPDAVSDVLRTRMLKIINEQGRAVLTAMPIGEDGGLLSLSSEGGVIGLEATGSNIMLFGNRAGNKTPIPNFSFGADLSKVKLLIRRNEQVAELVAMGQETMLSMGTGERTVSIGVTPSVALVSAKSQAGATIVSAGKNQSTVSVTDDVRRPRAGLGLVEGKTNFVLYDEDGRPLVE